jgi:hypothetical protein
MAGNDFTPNDTDHTQIFPTPGGKREDIAKMLQEERERRHKTPNNNINDDDVTIFQASPSSSSLRSVLHVSVS